MRRDLMDARDPNPHLGNVEEHLPPERFETLKVAES